MSLHDPTPLSARELAALVSTGQIAAREVVQAHLDRIAEVNPELNAVTRVLVARAIFAADAVDIARAAGEPVGVLAGVPVTVKENHDVAGTPTTFGVPALAQVVAARDAPAVTRGCGRPVRSRSRVPTFRTSCCAGTPTAACTARLRNPWDATRTPGGSSGGDAVAVATGMAALGLGSDLGGSARVPAMATGVTALEPTQGRVPMAGPPDQLPSMTQQLFAVVGLLARTVDDLMLAFGVVAGADPADLWSVPVPAELGYSGGSARCRVAVTVDPGGGGADPLVQDGVRRTAAALEAAGWRIEPVDPPACERGAQLWMRLISTELAASAAMFEQLAGDDARAFVRDAVAGTPPLERDALVAELGHRTVLARPWSEFLTRVPGGPRAGRDQPAAAGRGGPARPGGRRPADALDAAGARRHRGGVPSSRRPSRFRRAGAPATGGPGDRRPLRRDPRTRSGTRHRVRLPQPRPQLSSVGPWSMTKNSSSSGHPARGHRHPPDRASPRPAPRGRGGCGGSWPRGRWPSRPTLLRNKP
jgi:amidase